MPRSGLRNKHHDILDPETALKTFHFNFHQSRVDAVVSIAVEGAVEVEVSIAMFKGVLGVRKEL